MPRFRSLAECIGYALLLDEFFEASLIGGICPAKDLGPKFGRGSVRRF
jgi:hypothetical protein